VTTSPEEILMKNVLVCAETHVFFARSRAIQATITVLALLVCCGGGYSQPGRPEGRARFEPASVAIAAGNTCALHPEGNSDPAQSITVSADADGVARFQVVRPTRPESVDRLSLDCTDSNGLSQTYSVDLRSEATFAARPFDPALANLTYRPGLARDPLSYTQQELIQGGYGIRPDPAQNPDGYRRWLAAASAPAYKLRSVRSSSPAAAGPRPHPAPRPSGPSTSPMINAGVYTSSSTYWTGARLVGSYQKNATSALSYGYVFNEASFVVPTVTPGGYGTSTTAMTIWNGLDNVFQAIVDVSATATTHHFGIHRQNFYNNDSTSIDEEGTLFTPHTGDTIYAQEWYCDAKGNVQMSGGYGCTYMSDMPAGGGPAVVWECDQANGKDCQSYTIDPSDLTNGALGKWAEFIIEDDTGEVGGNCPAATKTTHCYDEWPDFSPVTMNGSVFVVQGVGVSETGTWVTTDTDPTVQLLADNTASVPYERGDGHLLITLPTGGVKWHEVQSNIYYWNGDDFNNLSTPQVTPAAQPGVISGCATSLAVGPNSSGLTNGTPWRIGCDPFSDLNFSVYQMQTGGVWVKMQDDVATQLAVSPDGGIAWAINAKGDILYWNGSKFVVNPAGGCATSIGVGPNSFGLMNGTPWITGCTRNADGNYGVYQMQTGGAWVKMQNDVATLISVSPDGIPWAINHTGDILYWNGSKFVVNATGGCATSIAVGPNSFGLSNGTPWITGCSAAADGNHGVYQMQKGIPAPDSPSGITWVLMQDDVAAGALVPAQGMWVAVSPEGNAWAVSTLK
jgi:hypothetical protein